MSGEQPAPRKPPVENFSFDSLREEMGDLFPIREEAQVPETNANGERISLSEQEALREKREREAKINAKVLGASGAVAPPMWIRGLVLVGVAALLFYLLVLNSSFQPIGSYVTMIVSAGAALWNANGVLKDEEPRDRALAAAGAVIGAALLVLTFFRMGA